MAKIIYQVAKKPIEERIIDAACIYWEVDREYFFNKTVDRTVTYRKGVIYYLLHNNTTYSYKSLAEKFGFLSHQPVLRLVESMDCTKDAINQHAQDINQIQHLADTLDAAFIQTEIKLIQMSEVNSMQITPGTIEKSDFNGDSHLAFPDLRSSPKRLRNKKNYLIEKQASIFL